MCQYGRFSKIRSHIAISSIIFCYVVKNVQIHMMISNQLAEKLQKVECYKKIKYTQLFIQSLIMLDDVQKFVVMVKILGQSQ